MSGMDSNGMEHEPQYLDTWHYNECSLNVDTDGPYWNQKRDDIDININCQKWEAVERRLTKQGVSTVK